MVREFIYTHKFDKEWKRLGLEDNDWFECQKPFLADLYTIYSIHQWLNIQHIVVKIT